MGLQVRWDGIDRRDKPIRDRRRKTRRKIDLLPHTLRDGLLIVVGSALGAGVMLGMGVMDDDVQVVDTDYKYECRTVKPTGEFEDCLLLEDRTDD